MCVCCVCLRLSLLSMPYAFGLSIGFDQVVHTDISMWTYFQSECQTHLSENSVSTVDYTWYTMRAAQISQCTHFLLLFLLWNTTTPVSRLCLCTAHSEFVYSFIWCGVILPVELCSGCIPSLPWPLQLRSNVKTNAWPSSTCLCASIRHHWSQSSQPTDRRISR